MLSGDQLRMARAALRLTVKDVAEMAGIDKGTIVRIEAGERAYRLTLEKLRTVLEAQGLEFLDAGEAAGDGVRFKAGVKGPLKGRAAREAAEGGEGDLKAFEAEALELIDY